MREKEKERGREKGESGKTRETFQERGEKWKEGEREIGFRTEGRAFTIEKKEIDKKRER